MIRLSYLGVCAAIASQLLVADDAVVATVNGQPLHASMVLRGHNDVPEERRQALVDAAIDREVLYQYGKAQGYHEDPEIIRALAGRVADLSLAHDEVLAKYYEQQQEELVTAADVASVTDEAAAAYFAEHKQEFSARSEAKSMELVRQRLARRNGQAAYVTWFEELIDSGKVPITVADKPLSPDLIKSAFSLEFGPTIGTSQRGLSDPVWQQVRELAKLKMYKVRDPDSGDAVRQQLATTMLVVGSQRRPLASLRIARFAEERGLSALRFGSGFFSELKVMIIAAAARLEKTDEDPAVQLKVAEFDGPEVIERELVATKVIEEQGFNDYSKYTPTEAEIDAVYMKKKASLADLEKRPNGKTLVRRLCANGIRASKSRDARAEFVGQLRAQAKIEVMQ